VVLELPAKEMLVEQEFIRDLLMAVAVAGVQVR
jgi:hypothetical protein